MTKFRLAAMLVCFIAILTANGRGASAACSSAPAPGVDWSGCQKMRLIMEGEHLAGGTFNRTDLTATDLLGANLQKAQFEYANLTRVRLQKADLRAANLSRAYGNHVNFSAANLTGANLSKAEFSRADFSGADLTNVDLSKSELGRARFTTAILKGVNFRKANIARANLNGVTLQGSDLSGAFTLLTWVEGADLSAAVGLNQQQLNDMCGNETTKLPDGLSRPGNWPCAKGE